MSMATISKVAGVLLVLVLLSALIWWRDQAMADTYRLNRIKQLQQQRRALAADVLRARADCMEYGVEGVEVPRRDPGALDGVGPPLGSLRNALAGLRLQARLGKHQ